MKEEGREMCLFYRQGIAGLSYRQLAKTMDTGELLGETSLSLLAYPKWFRELSPSSATATSLKSHPPPFIVELVTKFSLIRIRPPSPHGAGSGRVC